jgi:hypothetical protein
MYGLSVRRYRQKRSAAKQCGNRLSRIGRRRIGRQGANVHVAVLLQLFEKCVAAPFEPIHVLR